MAAIERTYLPYEGNEPYLHLCFSNASGKKVLALLRRLRMRGVRVFFETGTAADRDTREAMNARMLGASMTVIYLDDAFRNDPAAKSRLLFCQRNNQRLVCLNTDGGDSGLSIGLHPGATEIVLSRTDGAEAAERALLHAEGFSQEMIGEPEKPKHGRIRILTGVLAAVTVVLLAVGAVRYIRNGEKRKQQAQEQIVASDTVTFADASVREAVRDALGGGILTEERLSEITSLYLPGDALPEDLSDLALLKNLETVLLSQTAAKDWEQHPALVAYTVELYGGGTP